MLQELVQELLQVLDGERLAGTEPLGRGRYITFSGRRRPSYFDGLLGKTLPPIGNISDNMHDRPHLRPHCFFHWLFSFVVMRLRSIARGRRIGDSSRSGQTARIRNRLIQWIRLWVSLLVLPGRAAKSDSSDSSHKVSGFLLSCLSMMILWCSSRTIMAPQHTCCWRLNTSILRIN